MQHQIDIAKAYKAFFKLLSSTYDANKRDYDKTNKKCVSNKDKTSG